MIDDAAGPRRGAGHRDALALAAGQRLDRLAHRADADLQVGHLLGGLLAHAASCRACGRRCRAAPGGAARGRGTGWWRCPGQAPPPGPGRRSRCRRARRRAGCGSWTGSPSRQISPSSGITAPESALIRLDLPAPLSPMTARISPGSSSKSAPSMRGHVAVALDQAAGLQDRRGESVAVIGPSSREIWSTATARMTRMPVISDLVDRRDAHQLQAVAEHADDQRADQRADDRAAAAEQARAAEHHRGDASRLSVWPRCGSPTPVRGPAAARRCRRSAPATM